VLKTVVAVHFIFDQRITNPLVTCNAHRRRAAMPVFAARQRAGNIDRRQPELERNARLVLARRRP